MFAVVAVFLSGRRHLIGFANTEAEVNDMVKQVIEANGEEFIKKNGIHFNVEFAA